MERCEAKARHGGRCAKPAGWGTVHKGRGPCRLHGGCLPNVIAHYEHEETEAFARQALGEASVVGPVEAARKSVHLAMGTVEYYRARLHEIEGAPPPALAQGYARALRHLSQFAAAALKAGVEEREFELAEEAANLIAGAIDRAAAPLKLTREDRAAFAKRVERELRALDAA